MWSNCIAIQKDVHTLESSLDYQRESISGWNWSLSPIRGLWVLYRAAWQGKYYFPPLTFGLSERSRVKPQGWQKITLKFIFLKQMFLHSCQMSYLIFLACSFCHAMKTSFRPFTITWWKSQVHIFLSFFTIQYARLLLRVENPFYWVLDTPLSCWLSSHLIKTSPVLEKQQFKVIGSWAHVAAWLPNFYHWKLVWTEMKLKEQCEESE